MSASSQPLYFVDLPALEGFELPCSEEGLSEIEELLSAIILEENDLSSSNSTHNSMRNKYRAFTFLYGDRVRLLQRLGPFAFVEALDYGRFDANMHGLKVREKTPYCVWALFEGFETASIENEQSALDQEREKSSHPYSLSSSSSASQHLFTLRRPWTALTNGREKEKKTIYLPMAAKIETNKEGAILKGRYCGYALAADERSDLLTLNELMRPKGRKKELERGDCEKEGERGEEWGEVVSLLRWVVVKTARRLVGMPYLWGGNLPLFPLKIPPQQEAFPSAFPKVQGFDCSGLIYALWGKLALRVARDSRDQYLELCARSTSKEQEDRTILPGDLLFFRRKDGEGSLTIDHVALFADAQTVIEAKKEEGAILERSLVDSCSLGPTEIKRGWNRVDDELELQWVSSRPWFDDVATLLEGGALKT